MFIFYFAFCIYLSISSSSITVKYHSGGNLYTKDEGDYSATLIEFDDSTLATLFDNDATTYQLTLAKLSLGVALSSFRNHPSGTPADTDYYSNAKDFLKDLGCVEGKIKGYGYKEGSVPMVIGQKEITGTNSYTLVVVGVAGGQHDVPWSMLFNVGQENDHEGFGSARDTALQNIRSYIADTGTAVTGAVKFWIAGFGVGGAVASLVGADLTDGLEITGITYDKTKDVYVYAFNAVPHADRTRTTPTKPYSNIHQLCDGAALLTHLPWLTRLGTDHPLPSSLNTLSYQTTYRTPMATTYKTYDATQDEDPPATTIFGKVLNELAGFAKPLWGDCIMTSTSTAKHEEMQSIGGRMRSVLENRISRSTYSSKHQTEMIQIGEVLDGVSAEVAWNFFIQLGMWYECKYMYFEYRTTDVTDDLQATYKTLFDAYKVAKSTEEYPITISTAAARIQTIIVESGINPKDIVTLASAIQTIEALHKPEIVLSWISSMTTWPNPELPAKYRVFTASQDVDITLKYGDDTVASIKDGNPVGYNSYELPFGLDQDNQAFVYVPFDTAKDYSIVLSAKHSLKMSCTVFEHSSTTDETTSAVSYMNVDLDPTDAAKKEFTLTISDKSNPVYKLQNPNSQTISRTYEYTGETLDRALVYISVSSSDDSLGTVSGSGLRTPGTAALLTAQTLKTSIFQGWYKGEAPFSYSTTTFVTTPDSNESYVARFATAPEENNNNNQAESPNEELVSESWKNAAIALGVLFSVSIFVLFMVLVCGVVYTCCKKSEVD